MSVNERVRYRLEYRRSNSCVPHANRKRRAQQGSGKGGRGAAQRSAIREQF